MTNEFFRAQLGTIFRVAVAGADIPLQLVNVSDVRASGGFEAYSVFFHGPATHVLNQGTYTLGHERLDALSLFIVPITGSNAERIVYEACFNQRAQSRD